MKVKFSLGIGFAGAVHKETMDYEDDTTDELIEQDFGVWCQNYIDGAWWKVEEDEDEDV